MRKREKIIEILKRHEHGMAGHNWLIGLDESDFILCADEILALPLDVPTQEERMKLALKYAYRIALPECIALEAMEMLIEEIIKRNK